MQYLVEQQHVHRWDTLQILLFFTLFLNQQ